MRKRNVLLLPDKHYWKKTKKNSIAGKNEETIPIDPQRFETNSLKKIKKIFFNFYSTKVGRSRWLLKNKNCKIKAVIWKFFTSPIFEKKWKILPTRLRNRKWHSLHNNKWQNVAYNRTHSSSWPCAIQDPFFFFPLLLHFCSAFELYLLIRSYMNGTWPKFASITFL